MRSTIKDMFRSISALLCIAPIIFIFSACGKKNADSEVFASKFEPYQITDSAQVKTYPDGLSIYVVEAGPGDVPQNGEHVQMHYHGILDDGTVFDESYSRNAPLEFTIGSGKVIAGIESAARKLRLGTKAIVTIPPSLGYGDGKDANGKDVKLPPKIPANARLTFHIDLVGSF
jgi:peptidyl-prolyl cis-trans isomerase A (cyclophilin A)